LEPRHKLTLVQIFGCARFFFLLGAQTKIGVGVSADLQRKLFIDSASALGALSAFNASGSAVSQYEVVARWHNAPAGQRVPSLPAQEKNDGW